MPQPRPQFFLTLFVFEISELEFLLMPTSRAAGILFSTKEDCSDIYKAHLRHTAIQIYISEVTVHNHLFHKLLPSSEFLLVYGDL